MSHNSLRSLASHPRRGYASFTYLPNELIVQNYYYLKFKDVVNMSMCNHQLRQLITTDYKYR